MQAMGQNAAHFALPVPIDAARRDVTVGFDTKVVEGFGTISFAMPEFVLPPSFIGRIGDRH